MNYFCLQSFACNSFGDHMVSVHLFKLHPHSSPLSYRDLVPPHPAPPPLHSTPVSFVLLVPCAFYQGQNDLQMKNGSRISSDLNFPYFIAFKVLYGLTHKILHDLSPAACRVDLLLVFAP